MGKHRGGHAAESRVVADEPAPAASHKATAAGVPVAWSAAELAELREGGAVGAAFTAAVAAVLVRTMHPTVAGGDSGELMGAACELGVAHPPGYPLFTMLSWLGTQVIPVGTPGYRLNCVSVLFAVLAAYFHFSAVLRWHLGMVRAGVTPGAGGGEQWRGSAWVALIASGTLVFCPLLWQYSTHAEVFAMNNMFVAILLYLGVRYVQERQVVWARLGALFIGLGLTNQHTLLLYALPLVAWMLHLGRAQLLNPREFGILAALGLLGLTPYLYLFWAATHAPLGSWGDTSTLSGICALSVRACLPWPHAGRAAQTVPASHCPATAPHTPAVCVPALAACDATTHK
jgi:hypothetical protein